MIGYTVAYLLDIDQLVWVMDHVILRYVGLENSKVRMSRMRQYHMNIYTIHTYISSDIDRMWFIVLDT